VGSALLARTAAQMYALALVLFVLARFHSPQLAGLTVLASIAPGLVVSPLAGAVLDRGARVTLIVIDYTVGAAALALLAALAGTDHLARPALLGIVAVASLTQPLSNAGLRSALPLLTPREMWDRVNAVDSGTYLVAMVVGPGTAGLLVAVVGPTWALLGPAAGLAAGAALLPGVRIPASPKPTTPMLRDAWEGLVYVVRNRALRMLAVMISVFNLAGGAMTVGLPVLVLHKLHGGSAETGVLFATMGATGIASGLVFGRIGSEGRERLFLSAGALASTVAFALLALAGRPVVAFAGMGLMGIANGPLDLGLFSLRQRATEPAWFGRAFAVSMSLNFLGVPIGAAIAGPLVARSVALTFTLAAATAAVSAALPYVTP